MRKEKSLSITTINSYIRGLRAILYFGMQEEYQYISRFKIELLKYEKKLKQGYTDKELELLLKKPNMAKCDFVEYRNWVIVNYFLGTGNRLSTVLNIKICDIDFDNNIIILTKTKNRKQQIIPLSSVLVNILKEYLTHRKGQNEDYLFCDLYGNQLTKDSLQKSIQSYNSSRGVEKTSVHLFRHDFTKKWILNGGDIFRLQKILGHSSLDIVKEYVNMLDPDLKTGFDNYNPLDRFLKEQNVRKDRIIMRK